MFSKRYEAVSDAMEQRRWLGSPRGQGQGPRFEKGKIVPEEFTLADPRLQA